MENIIKAIFPPRCVFCGAVGGVFCDNCISNCSLLLEQRCLICDKPSFSGKTHSYHLSGVKVPSQFISSFIYEKNVRECIRKSKYFSRIFSCLKRLSFEGVNIVYEWGYSFEGYTVLPIPVSASKEKLRGFNQADIISKIFARRFGLSVDYSILVRTKDKHAQHDLSREERFKNIKGAFSLKESVGGRRFVLVDDICTTGATFLEAAKVLYENGALDVKCFSLSKKL